MGHWRHPFPESTITGTFGERSAYRIKHGLGPHRGVDYAPGVKSLIPAVTNGKVELIQWSSVLGWVMVQSSASRKYFIGYCHLSCGTHGPYCQGPQVSGCTTPFKNLKLGDSVKVGQPVGRVGSTGSASSGPHLHITLGKDLKSVFYGKVYDIQAYINKQIKKHGKVTDAVQTREKETKKVTQKTDKPAEPTEVEQCETDFDDPPKGIVAALRMILKWLQKLGVTQK